MFAAGSRYTQVPDATYVDRLGRTVTYKLLRPFPPRAPVSQAIEVAEGERLDLIAARIYGDPEQFWRICDVNHALWPDELTESPGRRLEIPLGGS